MLIMYGFRTMIEMRAGMLICWMFYVLAIWLLICSIWIEASIASTHTHVTQRGTRFYNQSENSHLLNSGAKGNDSAPSERSMSSPESSEVEAGTSPN